MLLRVIIVGVFILLVSPNLSAQCYFDTNNNQLINTLGQPCIGNLSEMTPFLSAETDALSLGQANIGVVAKEGQFNTALSQNPALMTGQQRTFWAQASYTPWLEAIDLTDVYLLNLSAVGVIDKKQAIGLQLIYLDLGESLISPAIPAQNSPDNIYEWSFSAAYARRLSEYLSLGMAVKYFISDVGGLDFPNQPKFQSAKGLAFNTGLHYRRIWTNAAGNRVNWHLGLGLTNIGSKVRYLETAPRQFIPTSMLIGTTVGWTYPLNRKQRLQLALSWQISKLLTPTPCTDGNCDKDGSGVADYLEQSAVKGMFASFFDAPDGFQEELKETVQQFGMETNIRWSNFVQTAFRLGYYIEHPDKGNRKWLSIGTSLAIEKMRINLAYINGLGLYQLPLDDTLSIGLGFQEEF
ncbi:MAG TPA: PorV/PorQ family protein [Saprospiraceae bacterium]|nr:PorV/PorQ family protein [Saprospiraceae bacterium]HMQ85103.1 PorV/PorQ family protein [Saprospiraceae bacterium]